MQTITLNDGVVVQVELTSQQATEISTNPRVNKTLETMKESFSKIAGPISDYAASIKINERISETKLSMGLKVGVEGNLILSKSSADAHIAIEFTIKNKS